MPNTIASAHVAKHSPGDRVCSSRKNGACSILEEAAHFCYVHPMSTQQNASGSTGSAYSRVFAGGPVAWHDWSADTLRYAREHNRPLFVSAGSAESPVAHLMAQEAFASDSVADYLNTAFVPVLVDRRLRPDIASYLTEFSLTATQKSAWPLHVFLTPELRPYYAFSYIGIESRAGAPGFMELLWKMRGYFDENRLTQPDFAVEGSDYRRRSGSSGVGNSDEIASMMRRHHDSENGGFGTAPKFPPHSPLMFLLSLPRLLDDHETAAMARKTLDSLLERGLWDNSGGGFYAYCTDAAWRSAAREKTLLDQVLHIWNYSRAYHAFRHEPYRDAVLNTIRCIETQFRSGTLSMAARSSSTLTAAGFSDRHQRSAAQTTAEDETILTSWNALLGCALAVAHECGVDPSLRSKAEEIRAELEATHIRDGRLVHASYAGVLQPHDFLEDYAAMALLDLMLSGSGVEAEQLLFDHHRRLAHFFYGNGWMTALVDDFRPVPAKDHDSPSPSPASWAELSLLLIRMRLERNEEHPGRPNDEYRSPLLELGAPCFAQPLVSDLRNLTAALGAGCASPLLR